MKRINLNKNYYLEKGDAKEAKIGHVNYALSEIDNVKNMIDSAIKLPQSYNYDVTGYTSGITNGTLEPNQYYMFDSGNHQHLSMQIYLKYDVDPYKPECIILTRSPKTSLYEDGIMFYEGDTYSAAANSKVIRYAKVYKSIHASPTLGSDSIPDFDGIVSGDWELMPFSDDRYYEDTKLNATIELIPYGGFELRNVSNRYGNVVQYFNHELEFNCDWNDPRTRNNIFSGIYHDNNVSKFENNQIILSNANGRIFNNYGYTVTNNIVNALNFADNKILTFTHNVIKNHCYNNIINVCSYNNLYGLHSNTIDVVQHNYVKGGIMSNVFLTGGDCNYNNVQGSISGNNNCNLISYNTTASSINNNSIGTISNNMVNGQIYSNTGGSSIMIKGNNNNGNIGPGARVSNIIGTQVNL